MEGYRPTAGYGAPDMTHDTNPSNGYMPPATSGYEPPSREPYSQSSGEGYETPQDGGYAPPSYEPATMNDEPASPIDTKPKKKSFMDDDDDELVAKPAAQKSKAEMDREADKAFREAAEADGKSYCYVLYNRY